MILLFGRASFGSVVYFLSCHQLSIPSYFIPVLAVNEQHAKAFSLVPVYMFVVHFMGPSYSAYIGTSASAEPFKALMDDHIVYNKIGCSINHDAKTQGLHPPVAVDGPGKDQDHAGHCEDHKEPVVLFKKAGFFLMVVFVQVP